MRLKNTLNRARAGRLPQSIWFNGIKPNALVGFARQSLSGGGPSKVLENIGQANSAKAGFGGRSPLFYFPLLKVLSLPAIFPYFRLMLLPEQDPMGRAMLDYLHRHDDEAYITVHCDVADDDVIPVKLLFRDWDSMSEMEHIALESCYGRVLDLGAGAGSHALELQKRNIEVMAADISPGAILTMQARGVKNTIGASIEELGNERFDTILLMMNGIGIAGSLQGLRQWLLFAKKILLPGGQIIFDTSDIEYLYMEDDGSIEIPMDRSYYGEVEYQMEYKNVSGPKFPWLFIDSITLTDIAFDCGFDTELLDAGENFTYLVRLTRL